MWEAGRSTKTTEPRLNLSATLDKPAEQAMRNGSGVGCFQSCAVKPVSHGFAVKIIFPPVIRNRLSLAPDVPFLQGPVGVG